MDRSLDRADLELDEDASGSFDRGVLARWLEFVLLFGGIPVTLLVFREALGAFIVPIILVVAASCYLVLRNDPAFPRERLWQSKNLRGELRRVLMFMIPAGLVLAVGVAVFLPQEFLGFPRQAFYLWLAVMFFYPVFSAYPQELIYRAYFFHRYEPLFGDRRTTIMASSLAFGFAHVFMLGWIAPILTLIGGYLFSITYQRSNSILAAAIEHAIWGQLLFTVGLGRFFYGGAAG